MTIKKQQSVEQTEGSTLEKSARYGKGIILAVFKISFILFQLTNVDSIAFTMYS